MGTHTLLIKNAKIVNEGQIIEGDIYIENDIIIEIAPLISPKTSNVQVIDVSGNYVLR